MALIKNPHSVTASNAAADLSFRDYEQLLFGALVDDRRLAVRGLAEWQNDEWLPMMIAALKAEKDAGVQDLILQTLRTRGGNDVVDALVGFLVSEDAHLRNSVIDVLQQMPQEMESHIDLLLADENSDVRIFAINILASLQHPHVPQWLEAVITDDTHLNVCMTALDLLAETGEKRMCLSIDKLLTRFPNEPYVAFSVAQVKKRLGCTP
jgi:HEAT repeat protein